MQTIEPLVTTKYTGDAIRPDEPGQETRLLFKVMCRECGDVTRTESGGTVNDATLTEAGLYAQRHLVKHLEALTANIKEFAR